MAKFLNKSRMLASMAVTMTKQFAARYYIPSDVRKASTNMSATYRLAQGSRSLVGRRSNGYGMRDFFVGDPNGTRDELEQRRMKIDESFERMKRLSTQRPQVNKSFGMPFKQEHADFKKPLKKCVSVEDILNYSSDPFKLATELLGKIKLLEKEQKKNEDIVKRYRQLEAYAFNRHK